MLTLYDHEQITPGLTNMKYGLLCDHRCARRRVASSERCGFIFFSNSGSTGIHNILKKVTIFDACGGRRKIILKKRSEHARVG